jgi:hypothetical protein
VRIFIRIYSGKPSPHTTERIIRNPKQIEDSWKGRPCAGDRRVLHGGMCCAQVLTGMACDGLVWAVVTAGAFQVPAWS